MVASPVLQPVTARGWRSGFANLLRKEFSLWWSTWRWAKQLAVWLALLNGIVAMAMMALRQAGALSAMPNPLLPGIELFLGMGATATAIGMVLAAQDAIIGERQTGTAAWVLSKPASRTAFVLAKFIAHGSSMLVLSIAVQSVVFFGQMWLWTRHVPALVPFLGALGILTLHLLFYLAAMLLLGTIFHGRGAATGTGLAFLFAGAFLKNPAHWWYIRLPWCLGDLSVITAEGNPLPPGWQVPLLVTAAATVIALGLALWRFQREEL